ncbi:serine hydrolase domain-containing protein [Pseudemcibacter aquimaris]|uniref:serine hydrolase domain-containing protein n=1 Tax=Pseudemcibacter aquimaris TaxID=2857064 RepID=UPI002012F1E7|nr:serine hydrolase domain-containing protein [Pseudemcibacter aquimaris]MCC3860204.1 beta-lactamase family protein [Pseudemcibacter aquimaris]WDU57529.1 beta-lactamase family protein [Pseudemcibacter aquimaris]
MRILTAIFTLLLIAQTAFAQNAYKKPGQANLREMDREIRKYMRDNNIPGGLVAVAKGGKLDFVRTYGKSNVELDVDVDENHVFEIGSISKQFVAAAAMLQVEEGKLNLDDKIEKYLPNLPSEWVGVTVKQLFNHTSGIPDYEEIYTYDVYRLRMTPEDIIKIASGRPVDFEPGQGWYYSNTGHYLASMIVERVDGMPIGKVLESRIFEPLGMSQTRFADPEAIIMGRAEGYWVNRNGELINRNATETSSTLGAGGLLSSAADMAKWDHALYGNDLLSEESKKIMWETTILPDGRDMEYGLGWDLELDRGLKTTNHSGQVAGFVAYFSRYIDEDVAVIVFLNRYRVSSRTVKDIMLNYIMPGS